MRNIVHEWLNRVIAADRYASSGVAPKDFSEEEHRDRSGLCFPPPHYRSHF